MRVGAFGGGDDRCDHAGAERVFGDGLGDRDASQGPASAGIPLQQPDLVEEACRQDEQLFMLDLAEKPSPPAARALDGDTASRTCCYWKAVPGSPPALSASPAATRHQQAEDRGWHWQSPPTPAITRSS